MKVNGFNWQENPSKENYFEEMFKNVPIDPEEVKYLVRDAIQEWKRRDRITYTLKIDRYFFCKKFPNHRLCQKIVRNFEKKYGRLLPEDWTHGTGQLSHYLNFAINNRVTRMLNLVWQDQSLEDLLQILHELEQEHLLKLKGEDRYFIPEDEEEIILEFPESGFYWVRLDGEDSPQEACSMGHCGVSSTEDSLLLSLRSRHGTEVKSHLTFAWKPINIENLENGFDWKKTWGVLGERKGYKNSKPSAFYHKYIVELLLQPQIQILLKTNYKPEADFSLNDLNVDLKNELLRVKPQLASWKFMPTEKLREFFTYKTDVITDGNQIELLEKDSAYNLILSLLHYFELSTKDKIEIETCIEYLTGEKTLNFWGEPDKNHWIRLLKEKNVSLYKRLRREQVDSHDIYLAMISAEQAGYEIGTLDLMHEGVMDLLDGLKSGASVKADENGNVKLLIAVEKSGILLEVILNQLKFEDINDFTLELEDVILAVMEFPKRWRGVQDTFDEDAAYVRFEEDLQELI